LVSESGITSIPLWTLASRWFGDSLEATPATSPLPVVSFYGLAFARDGALWIAAGDGGVIRFGK